MSDRWYVDRLTTPEVSNVILVNFRGASRGRSPPYLARDHVADVIVDNRRLQQLRNAWARRSHNRWVGEQPVDGPLPWA